MAVLPNANLAIVDSRKLTHYLLGRTHPVGGPKAAFFERFDFRSGSWQNLRDAILTHAHAHEVEYSYVSRYGSIYEVVGPLSAPDGRTPIVRVVWMIRHGEIEPRLVTAVPS